MRPARILALASALAAAALGSAQDNFPDVPANHWAYEALARMKRDGLLVGYPDGLYRGGRPASRYELAVAMHAVYTNLKNVTDGLDAQIRALQANPGASASDVQALKDAIAALQSDLAAMRGYGDDIAALKRATDTFELELTGLGVDVQAMKDDLKGLAGRVRDLEAKKAPLEISGDVDFWLGGGHTADGEYGLTRDGRLTGIKDKTAQGVVSPDSARAGITDDLAILHEVAVTATSTRTTGIGFRGTLVATNAFGQDPLGGVASDNVGFGNQSDVFNPSYGSAGNPAFLGYAEGTGDLYLQELFATSDVGRRGNVEFGRVRYRANPWIFRRIDNTTYFANDRWDDGKYTFDGLVFRQGLGPVRAEVYGGKNDSVQTVNGFSINPVRSGAVDGPLGDGALGASSQRLEAERTLGGALTTTVKGVSLRGDYLVLDADTSPVLLTASTFDHLSVYGGQADFQVGRYRVEGGLRQSRGQQNGGHIDGLTDTAWDAKVAWAGGRYDLSAQYRQVGTNYLAPGDWGRLGILRNPTNVRGFLGSAKVALARRLDLGLEGELSAGLDNDRAGTSLDRDTKIRRYGVNLGTKFDCGLAASVYYEETRFVDLANDAIDGTPQYRWYGVGLTYALAGNATFGLSYEQSAVRNDYQTTAIVGNGFRGGFLTSQVTVKF